MLRSRRISPAYRKPHTRWQRPAPLTGGMNHTAPARPSDRAASSELVVAGLARRRRGRSSAVPVHRRPASSSPTITLAHRVPRGEPQRAAGRGRRRRPRPASTVFDDDTPARDRLDPALLDALRRAATHRRAATGSSSTSTAAGARRPTRTSCCARPSSKYGSEAEAARWVATADHVRRTCPGDAVDVGRADAAAWLSRARRRRTACARSTATSRGTSSCAPTRSTSGCPPSYADPTHDPRMQQ